MNIKVLGIDAAFANMGLCSGTVYTGNEEKLYVDVEDLLLLKTEKTTAKQVRKSSDDLHRARYLHKELTKVIASTKPDILMCEVPHGSKSARASWSLGIVIGVLSSLGVPMVEVTALDVKMASVGKKTASKEEIISWATSQFPDAPWIKHNGRLVNSNEHLADAVATIFAGSCTEEFNNLVKMAEVFNPVKQLKVRA